jgi:hypothetical protein
MTPVIAWTIGWTIFVVSAGGALIAIDSPAAGQWVAVLLLAGGGIVGMATGARVAAQSRGPHDPGAPGRQVVAWTAAGIVAFGLFALSLPPAAEIPAHPGDVNAADSRTSSSNRIGSPSRQSLVPDRYASVVRLLVWFGAMGGFLAVVAAAGWHLRFWVLVRGLVAGAVWSGLVLGCGVGAFLGLYFGAHVLADAMGDGGIMVAGVVAGLVTGAFLARLGEAVNRLTLRPIA